MFSLAVESLNSFLLREITFSKKRANHKHNHKFCGKRTKFEEGIGIFNSFYL
jgi:hypothetical protein